MRKRKILATGGLMTTLILGGASSSYAKTLKPVPAPTHKHESDTDIDDFDYDESSRPDMTEFGIEEDGFATTRAEFDENSRYSLIGEGFSPTQVHKLVTRASELGKRSRNSAVTEI